MPVSTERNILSVSLPPLNGSVAEIKAAAEQLTISPLTNTEQSGFYSASFSPEAGFYMLNYDGPRVPWQAIMKVGDDGKDLSLFKLLYESKINKIRLFLFSNDKF